MLYNCIYYNTYTYNYIVTRSNAPRANAQGSIICCKHLGCTVEGTAS